MRNPLSLALVLLAALPLLGEPQTMTGQSVIRSIGGNRVAVFLDTDADDAVNEGFLLSSDLPVPSTTARAANARVVFTDGYLRLTYDGKVFDLYVAGYPEPPEVPEPVDLTKYVGYALQHSSGNSGCTLDRAVSDPGACFGYGKE